MEIASWPHQIKAVELLRKAVLDGYKRIMIQLPTGAGKTKTAGQVISDALKKGNNCSFTAPAIGLIDQTVQSFYNIGITEIGVIQADHHMTDWSKPVQVISPMTLMRRDAFPDCKIVFVDEAHEKQEIIKKWMDENPDIIFIGLSATPWSKGLGDWYQVLIKPTNIKKLIEGGYLSKWKAWSPDHPDRSGLVKTVNKEGIEDYTDRSMLSTMDKKPLVAKIVQNWIENGENRPTFCFCVNRKHARSIQEEFEAANIPCGYIDAFTKPHEREQLKNDFHEGKIKVVCNVGCLTRGIDWVVSCAILARPLRSDMLYVQIIGRVLRKDQWEYAYIFDHSDTFDTLGSFEDIDYSRLHTAELDEQIKKERDENRKKSKTRECPKCKSVIQPGQSVCGCGFKPEPIHDVELVDGRLKEFGSSAPEKPKDTVNMKGKDIKNRDFYAMLLHHAEKKGYASGWAPNQYKKKIGEYPNEHRNVTPIKPVSEVQSWIKAMGIRYAMGKKKARSS